MRIIISSSIILIIRFSPKNSITIVVSKTPHKLIMGECFGHFSAFIFDWIFFTPASNEDMHKSLDEFECRSDPTTDYRVSCH